MAARIKQLTREEHEALARACWEFDAALGAVLLRTKNLKHTSREGRALEKMWFTGGYLGRLRSALDSAWYRDIGEECSPYFTEKPKPPANV